MEIAPWEAFVRDTALHSFVYRHEPWLWPILQTLHYFGATILIGTIGLFDLRALGVAKGIVPAAMHRLIPLGIAAYVWNALLGVVFFFGHPDQYFYNDAFRFKALFMAVAGINIAMFYGTTMFRDMKALTPDARAGPLLRLVALTSLSMWIAVLICGRLLTFFRPPFFH